MLLMFACKNEEKNFSYNISIFSSNIIIMWSVSLQNNHNVHITNFEKKHYKQDRVNLEDD